MAPKNRETRRSRRRNGFSLVELLVVIGIIAIVTTTYLGSMRQFGINFRISSATRDFASVLRTAQRVAVESNSEIKLILNQETSTWFIMGTPRLVGGNPTVYDKNFEETGTMTPVIWSIDDFEHRVQFGEMTTGGWIAFSPRLGRSSFQSGASEAYVTIIPKRAYFNDRFPDDDWNMAGEMDKFRSRRVIVTASGFVRVMRYHYDDGVWID